MTEPVRPTNPLDVDATPAPTPAPHWIRRDICDFFLQLKPEPEPDRRIGCRTKRPLVPLPELTLDQLTDNSLSLFDVNSYHIEPDATLVHWVHANLIEFALACKPGAHRAKSDQADANDHFRVIMFGIPGFPGQRGYLEPSFALAKEREMTERQLNKRLRELTGLTGRDWWDAIRVRYTDVRAKVRDDLDAMLRAWARDNKLALPTKGADLAQMLKRARAALGFERQVAALDLGFRNHARISRAFRIVTNMTLPQWERAVLEELALTYAREAAQHRAASKVPPQKREAGGMQSVSSALSASAASASQAVSPSSSAGPPTPPLEAAQVA